MFEPESDRLSEITSADESCCCGSFLVNLYSIWSLLEVFERLLDGDSSMIASLLAETTNLVMTLFQRLRRPSLERSLYADSSREAALL